MRLGDGVANSVKDHVDYMREISGDDTKVPVISEYGIFRSMNPMVRSQSHALYIARAIMEYAEQGSPYIQKHCLVDYYSSGAASLGPTQQAVIQAVAQGNLDSQKDGTASFKFFSTPSARIFEMLNSSFGSKMVDVALSNESTLSNGVSQHSVMASTDSNGTVYLAIVNFGLERCGDRRFERFPYQQGRSVRERCGLDWEDCQGPDAFRCKLRSGERSCPPR